MKVTLTIVLAALTLISDVVAQSSSGMPPMTPMSGGLYDTVKVRDGSVVLTLPIWTKNGLFPESYSLVWNNLVGNANVSGYHYLSNSYPGWVLKADQLAPAPYLMSTSNERLSCGSQKSTQKTGWILTDALGTQHPVPSIVVDTLNCFPSVYSGYASDGSGWYAAVTVANGMITTSAIRDRAGRTYTSSSVTDTNNNKFQFSTSINGSTTTTTFSDGTGGVTPMTEVETTDSSGNVQSVTYTYPTSQSAAEVITVTYTPMTVQTTFGCTYLGELGPFTLNLPTTISGLGNDITLSYEPTPGVANAVTGRLHTISLSSGATISYTYTGGNNNTGLTCPLSAGDVNEVFVPLLTRTLTDVNGTVRQWTYDTATLPGSTIVTGPDGNDTVHTFLRNVGISNDLTSLESQRIVYAGRYSAGVSLETVVTCYNNVLTNCATATPPIGPITQTDEYTTLPHTPSATQAETKFDSYGNIIEAMVYGFSGALLSDKTLTYSGTACPQLGSTIHDHVCSETTSDGHNALGQTTTSYDVNGNALQASRLVGGSQYLTSYATYNNTNGTVATTKDINSTVRQYDNNGCNGTLPTQISSGGMLMKMTWDCDGSVLTSQTDANGQVSSYLYYSVLGGMRFGDIFWRVKSATDPLNNGTTYTYLSNSREILHTGLDVIDYTDGFGRIVRTQRFQTGEAYDTVSYKYDGVGSLSSISDPCTVGQGADCSSSLTITAYDALGRPVTTSGSNGDITSYDASTYAYGDTLRTLTPVPSGENSKQVQYEYDGGGRVVSVCEITTATGSNSCGQRVARTGYLTTYAYDSVISNSIVYRRVTVTENAQGPVNSRQVRTFLYDLIGRLVQETNPESGLTSYVYDTDVTCGTSAGDLVKKSDANGNVTCYSYDFLHRVTAVSYMGPNSAATPMRSYVYDTTTFSCPNGGYVMGRLAEAYTYSGGKVVDDGFCYSARGEVTDIYQSTPHSNGLIHVTQAYSGSGQTSSIGGLPIPTLTYSEDSEGRWSSVSATSGQNPITSVTYNAAGAVTGVTYGSGDADTLQWSHGLLQNVSYAVNGRQWVGTLLWNPNRTLQQLNIADPFNPAASQSCAYLYDDLLRLGTPPLSGAPSVNCNTAWQQTFSYDAFGNITKSGSSAWQPGYDPATNHYMLSGVTYDAKGELTNDTFNSYTWDVEGHPATITPSGRGSQTYTYDAMGRLAELFNGVQYLEVIYSPSGVKLGTMRSKSSIWRLYLPLPGGGQAVYFQSTSTPAYYRRGDWLHSARIASTPSRTVPFDTDVPPFSAR